MADSNTVRVDLLAAWLHGANEHQVEVTPLPSWEALDYPTWEPLFRSRDLRRNGGVYTDSAPMVFDLAGKVFTAPE